jgi:hypothetical protein
MGKYSFIVDFHLQSGRVSVVQHGGCCLGHDGQRQRGSRRRGSRLAAFTASKSFVTLSFTTLRLVLIPRQELSFAGEPVAVRVVCRRAINSRRLGVVVARPRVELDVRLAGLVRVIVVLVRVGRRRPAEGRVLRLETVEGALGRGDVGRDDGTLGPRRQLFVEC